MIVPWLAVRDIARSVRYDRATIGMRLTMTVSSAREAGWFGKIDGTSFATLELYDCHFLLPPVEIVAKELAASGLNHTLVPSGTVYFRNLHPDTVRHRVARGLNSMVTSLVSG